jgi:chromosomal replication initiation ATPase DnaA
MNRIKAEQIIYDICTYFKIPPDKLLQSGRGLSRYHLPRQLAMYLFHTEAEHTYLQAAWVARRGTLVSAYNATCKIEKMIRGKDATVINFLTHYRYCKHYLLKAGA